MRSETVRHFDLELHRDACVIPRRPLTVHIACDVCRGRRANGRSRILPFALTCDACELACANEYSDDPARVYPTQNRSSSRAHYPQASS